jgi:hypothetical protein
MYADSNLIVDTAAFGPFKFVKNIIVVGFVYGATQTQRQEAVESVRGVVVGGNRIALNGDGFYLIRLRTVTAAGILEAQRKLEALPQVDMAEPEVLTLRPFASSRAGRADWENPRPPDSTTAPPRTPPSSASP